MGLIDELEQIDKKFAEKQFETKEVEEREDRKKKDRNSWAIKKVKEI